MIAVIEKAKNGHIARFERHFTHSVEDVWSWLTENEKLTKWFSELSVEDLREGGMIKFDMQDGTFEEMAIIELKTNSILEYTWGEDSVRFQLYQKPEGCRLVFIEKIKVITPHTPKDLAGWHVCLDVIKALIDGKKIDSRQDEWKKWYEKYTAAIESL
jgi:uncharacterized protein YndB with AHSA1/START domain